ncbi:uncharacterized protein LOC126672864 [Mercurialis annua]|uniref:uncharacterized protein LOC126672864 n=1 Tax=Mercurialis annua TaxID=3986 RepID=UPI00216070FA|nr:uncharacterized protein LOC126672864 [Mercurialis annua]
MDPPQDNTLPATNREDRETEPPALNLFPPTSEEGETSDPLAIRQTMPPIAIAPDEGPINNQAMFKAFLEITSLLKDIKQSISLKSPEQGSAKSPVQKSTSTMDKGKEPMREEDAPENSARKQNAPIIIPDEERWMDEQHTLKGGEEHLEEKVRQVMSRLGIRCEDVDISLRSDSPLADFIISHEFPTKFRYPPNLESYDGTGCPKSHIHKFQAVINVQTNLDHVLCKLFPTTLKGLAQEWYQSLKPGSVLTFKQFSGLFQARFVACIPQKKLSTDLLAIMQWEGETLRKYVERFNKEAMQIEDLSQEIAYTALLNGTTNSDLRKELLAKSPKSFTTLMTIAHTQIRVDDGQREIENRLGRVEERTFAERRNGDRSPIGKRFGEKGNDHFRNKRKKDEDRRYTPLNTTRTNVLFWVKDSREKVRWPRKMNVASASKRDNSKYCEFHRDNGHTTDECWHLKEEIEKLIERGSLSQFVKRDTEARETESERKKERKEEIARRPRPEPAGVVNVIMGGSTGGDSNTTRKKAARTVYSVSPGAPNAKKFRSVSFSEVDSHGLSVPHEDALVVKGRLNNFEVSRMLVDTGSSVNMITMEVFGRIGLKKENLTHVTTPLVGLGGKSVQVEGSLEINIQLGDGEIYKEIRAEFMVVNMDFAYNAILGRPLLHDTCASICMRYLLMKIPTREGDAEVRGCQKSAREAYFTALRKVHITLPVLTMEPPEKKERAEHYGRTEKIELSPGKEIEVGDELEEKIRRSLTENLRSLGDSFAWTTDELIGVDPDVICHRLNIATDAKAVIQKKRRHSPEKQLAIAEEIARLKAANVIKDAYYPKWVANVVMVKKSNGTYRMCVDFTDLNKACPKDSFPLPHIDQLVDSTAGHALYTFLDARAGYHQIPMAPEDQEKTAFITDQGLFCYKMMPFGLKNAGATYQRLVNSIFRDQIGKHMEVYVDDMIIKSIRAEDHPTDVKIVLETLKRYQLKLNPEKCVFGVPAGKFLGYMVSQRGIEANPDKIEAVLKMTPPRSIHEVQKLNGRITALGRFMSCSAKRCLPFFKTLKQIKNFTWTAECQQAFEELKSFLSSPPLLARPDPGDVLYLYISCSDETIAGVLVSEKGGEQYPIYYISKVLRDAELRYPKLEKLALCVYTATIKLRHYFEGHQVIVRTDQPLRKILQKAETSGRIAEWAVKIGSLGVIYEARKALKAQALADFFAELTFKEPMEDKTTPWEMHVDGAVCGEGAGIGVVLKGPGKIQMEYSARLEFPASNNVAEYEALITGLQLCEELNISEVQICSDSQLVVNQVSGNFEVKEATLKKYAKQAKTFFANNGRSWSLQQIPRAMNGRSDELAKWAATKNYDPMRNIPHEIKRQPSFQEEIEEGEVLMVEGEETWMSPLTAYLANGILPEDKKEAKRIVILSSKFGIYNGQLYKRSFTHPWLRCVNKEEGEYIMKELHEGTCGAHDGASTLVRKALLQGYYWPTMKEQATTLVRGCWPCQQHALVPRKQASEMKPIGSAWPFAQWGMDILGPLPLATGQRKFLVVAIDHFTKWIEAEPLFDSAKFRKFCAEYQIDLRFTSVYHPQSNGQTEVANRILLAGLKRRLDECKGRWVEELYSVLWNYRTTPRESTGETPFALAYGTEAVIPVEIGAPTPRTEDNQLNLEENEEELRNNLDLLVEKINRSDIRMEAYRQKMAKHFNSHVKKRKFKLGDLVMRKTEVKKGEAGSGKLQPNWEGPYTISEVIKEGTFKLTNSMGRIIPRTWNANNLRKI